MQNEGKPAPRETAMTHHRLTLPALLLTAAVAAAQSAAPGQPAAPASASASAETTPAAPVQPATIQVPAGTRVLLELRSAIDTSSARPGDGVYLISTFPVVVGNRVVIPAGVYVQGVVDSVVRPGRGFGKKAQLNMHFTSMIFPNGSVVDIPGVVNSLPGARNESVKGDEGTIQQDGGSNKGHNAEEAAKIAVPTGATIGSVGGLESGHPLAGGLEGAAAGLAAAGVVALFTHGAEVHIPSGSQVEMVLQRPLLLQESNLNGPTSLVPATSQGQNVLGKPTLHPHMVCPAGSLGCS